MRIHESGEMYLETIHVLFKKTGHVRSIDISEHMGYSKPSVSRAVGILKSNGYIEVEKDGSITLTQSGLDIAEKIYQRHNLLANLLTQVGVSPETAEVDACKMEHYMSDETYNAIKHFLETHIV